MKKNFWLIIFCLNLGIFTTLHAQSGFEISWYDAVWRDPLTPVDIPYIEGKSVLLYTGGPSVLSGRERWAEYIDSAKQNNTDVIISIKEAVKDNLQNGMNMEEMVEYIMALPSYSAVSGWYIADEPIGSGVSVEQCQVAYDYIKSVSYRPVYMCIANDGTAIVDYSSTYDVIMFDDYPCRPGQDEFSRFENYYSGGVIVDGFKSKVLKSIRKAESVDKPIHVIVQAFGDDYSSSNWRLPTNKEERFMAYYAIHERADGLSFWSGHHVETAIAEPNEIYPYDGLTWKQEIATPLMAELDQLANALKDGPLQTGALDDIEGVYAKIFHDSQTDAYYLLTLNYVNSFKSGEINIKLPGEFTQAIPLGDDNGEVVDLIDNKMFLSFEKYQARNYLLVQVPEPSTIGLSLISLVLLKFRRRKTQNLNK